MKKSIAALVLALLMVAGSIVPNVSSVTNVYAATFQFAGATEISFSELQSGYKATGHVNRGGEPAYYKFNLESTGCFTYIKGCDFLLKALYNAEGGEVKTYEYDCENYLVAGTYYLEVRPGYEDADYSFVVGFTTSKESFAETQAKNNNVASKADKLTLGTAYSGVFGLDDYEDWFQFTIPANGTITLNYSHKNAKRGNGIAEVYPCYAIMDSSDNKLVNGNIYEKEAEVVLNVTKGTYSLLLNSERDAYTRPESGCEYDFKITYKLTETSAVSDKSKRTGTTAKIVASKAANVTGYQVTYSTSSKFSKKTTMSVTSKKTTVELTALDEAKNYYVKVRPYVKIGKKTYYGPYSKAVKFTK